MFRQLTDAGPEIALSRSRKAHPNVLSYPNPLDIYSILTHHDFASDRRSRVRPGSLQVGDICWMNGISSCDRPTHGQKLSIAECFLLSLVAYLAIGLTVDHQAERSGRSVSCGILERKTHP